MQTIIVTLEPSQAALCGQLWAVPTGLYMYQANPPLAAALFDYSILPQNKPAAKPAAGK